jgi:hypothetical protein
MNDRTAQQPKVSAQLLDRDTNTLTEWNGSAWVEIKRRWEIDPETFLLTGVGGGPFTGQEFEAIERPPCPVCGDTIDVAQISVRASGQRFPSYVPGSWQCPQGCDPRPRRT